MKKTILFFVSIITLFILTRCNLTGNEHDLTPVQDSLNYKQIVGKYIFFPNEFQAMKLGIKTTDTIYFDITQDSLKKFAGAKTTSYNGKFNYSNKNSRHKGLIDPLIKGNWDFFCLRLHDNIFINSIKIDSLKVPADGVTFQIQRDSDQKIHIVGYEQNESGAIIYHFQKLG